jgi:hypothetical protein
MNKLWGEGTPYYTQRNNLFKRDRACGRTSLANAFDALDIPFPPCNGQPEDALGNFIQTDPECQKLYMTKSEKDRKINPIEEWQDILTLGANRWAGVNACTFDEHAPLVKIFNHLQEKGVAVVTGAFPSANGTLSHSVFLRGVEWEGEGHDSIIKGWTINDPWGDFRTLYRVINGDKIPLTHEQFMRFLYKQNEIQKWCIFISKP